MKRIGIRDANPHNPSLESLTNISLKGVKLDATTIFNGLQGHWELQRRLGEYGTMWGDVVFIKVDNH